MDDETRPSYLKTQPAGGLSGKELKQTHPVIDCPLVFWNSTMAEIIRVWKAQAIPAQVVPDLRIEATEPIPEIDLNVSRDHRQWVNENQERFRQQAGRIVDAMFSSLPGGTVDAVFAELCERKASMLHVTL